MEHLSLKDDRFYGSGAAGLRTHSKFGPPRLPTPETSRSSLEAQESGSAAGNDQNHSTNESIWTSLFTNDQSIGFKGPGEMHLLQQLDTRPHGAPQSPPYDSLSEYRPSLPPLKTVLADSLSSPPRTPNVKSSRSHPGPQEPTTLATDTYKPLSLYPNKKQKIDALEPVPSYARTDHVAPHSTLFQYSLRTTMPTSNTFSPSLPHSPSIPRRVSNHRSNGYYASRSPAQPGHRGLIRGYTNVPPLNTALPRPTSQGETIDAFPMSSSSEYEPPSSTQNLYYPRPYLIDQRRPSERLDDRQPLPHPDLRYISPTIEEYRRQDRIDALRRVDQDRYSPRSELVHDAYPSSRPRDGFVQGPYECYYSKARKRSNLPKHSTEIMRQWFDQNIANPYPSEEQKALFANATELATGSSIIDADVQNYVTKGLKEGNLERVDADKDFVRKSMPQKAPIRRVCPLPCEWKMS